MVVDNEFLAGLQSSTLDKVHILIHKDITPKLKNYIQMLEDTKFRDGAYHVYYGELKIYLTSFIIFFSETIDEVIKEADKCSNVMNKQELIQLIDKTISIHELRQETFLKEFVPISDRDQQLYDDVVKKYESFMTELIEFKDNTTNKLDKQDKVHAFAKDHFKIAVEEINKLLTCTHAYVAKKASENITNILVSINEILLRLRNNLRQLHEEREEKLTRLLGELYDKNKENLTINREYKRSSLDIAEIQKCIDRIRVQIKGSEEEVATDRLEEEVAHWTKKVEEVREVEGILETLNKEYDHCVKQEKIYNSMRTTELPGCKRDCWEKIGESFAKRKQWLQERKSHAEKTMITIFCCRGNDRVIYTDSVGQYYVDEFNHQVYVKDHFLKVFHVNCSGEFIEVNEGPYYFDRTGRYILQDGQKVYRCAPCTSNYRLHDNGLLGKVTRDCGHSERRNRNCRLEIKDLTDVEILPVTEPVDIRKTLDSEVVKYLWDAFGYILPDALHSVGTLTPKNPIHYLAHMLIVNKCERTKFELREKRKEAQKYRQDVLKGRRDRAVAASLAWKAQQVKRRKPEESDDLLERTVYDHQMSWAALVNSLDYYY